MCVVLPVTSLHKYSSNYQGIQKLIHVINLNRYCVCDRELNKLSDNFCIEIYCPYVNAYRISKGKAEIQICSTEPLRLLKYPLDRTAMIPKYL